MATSRSTSAPLPRFISTRQTPPDFNSNEYRMEKWAEQLVDDLDRELADLNLAANTGSRAAKFQTSNVTTTKSLNPTSASTADVANVLGSLINALKERGVIA